MKFGVITLEEVSACDAFIELCRAKPEVSTRFSRLVEEAVKLGDFDGKLGTTTLVYTGGKPPRILLSGVDADWPREPWERLRWAAAQAASKLPPRVSRACIATSNHILEESVPEGRSVEWLWEQLLVAAYMAVSRWKTKGYEEKLEYIYAVDAPRESVQRAYAVSAGIRVARELAESPPSLMNPEGVEKFAERVARDYGLRLHVLHTDELREQGLNGILAVGAGSSVEPRLVILEYDGGSGPRVALIGKTVTFDSGGLNLKPPESMLDMKYDKAGGGVVLGTLVAAALLKLPVKLYALLPAVENMPSGSSYKPRDVLRMHNGVDVEVTNTDAEGRLTLADALSYAARELKAEYLIDVATLTSAAIIALGNHIAPYFANDERLAKLLERAAMLAGEPVWRMPLEKPYREQIKSEVADIVNSTGRPGALAVSAAFLAEFVDGKPWLHIDVAGVAWVQEKGPKRPYYPGGATGWGVRTLIELLRELVNRG